MRVYRVVVDVSGVDSEIRREELRYVAENISVVFKGIEWILLDPDKDVLAIIEEWPAVTVLNQESP